jgi:transposase-like protein
MAESLQSILQDEFNRFTKADPYVHNEDQESYRNGCSTRYIKTRADHIELEVYRGRDGLFQTELFCHYQTSE